MRIGGHKCHKRAGDSSMNFVCQFYVWIDDLVRHPPTGLSALAPAAAPKARQRFH
jgi:hypothetical protein